jgi:hypothetical protein
LDIPSTFHDYLIHEEIRRLNQVPRFRRTHCFVQHGGISVFDHSVSVARLGCRIAERLHFRVDYASLVRGALPMASMARFSASVHRMEECESRFQAHEKGVDHHPQAYVPVDRDSPVLRGRLGGVRRRQAMRNGGNLKTYRRQDHENDHRCDRLSDLRPRNGFSGSGGLRNSLRRESSSVSPFFQ